MWQRSSFQEVWTRILSHCCSRDWRVASVPRTRNHHCTELFFFFLNFRRTSISSDTVDSLCNAVRMVLLEQPLIVPQIRLTPSTSSLGCFALELPTVGYSLSSPVFPPVPFSCVAFPSDLTLTHLGSRGLRDRPEASSMFLLFLVSAGPLSSLDVDFDFFRLLREVAVFQGWSGREADRGGSITLSFVASEAAAGFAMVTGFSAPSRNSRISSLSCDTSILRASTVFFSSLTSPSCRSR